MSAQPSIAGTATEALIRRLRSILDDDCVITDLATRRLVSSDVYSVGITVPVVIRPRTAAQLAAAVAAATSAGFAVVPRGGGMSYTGGYLCEREDSVLVDVSGLDEIIEINEQDMYVTAGAGVTWKKLYAALAAKGLRLPAFGTHSGARATVGGGLSNGGLFFGTARFGTVADALLSLEVVLADGTLVRTGQAGFRAGRPFYRTYGPDLTGLFVHDTGALGIKTAATFRLIRMPEHTGYASFVFEGAVDAANALCEVCRTGAAEEAYVMDPESTQKNLSAGDFRSDLRVLKGVIKGQGSLLKGLKEGIALAAAGRSFIEADVFSLHVVCTGRTEAALQADLDACRKAALDLGGEEIANSIPKATRGDTFPPLNGILGPKGDRWAALNAKVGYSDAGRIITAADAILAEYRERMQALNITINRLFIGMSTPAFSYEPVFHWHDEWLPLHRAVPEAAHLARFAEPAPAPEARALVHEIRARLANLFADLGAASNQIGKTYPYLDALNPETRELLKSLKKTLDPKGLLNPGALGLR
jgi:FAD/FMN-containing dehydrogenase